MEKNLAFFVRIEKLKEARKKERVKDEEIFKILKDFLNKKIIFRSQGSLIRHIRALVGDKNLPSKEKIRRIAIKAGYKIKYTSRRTDEILDKCPICTSPLFERYSINLKNEKIIDYYYCKFCNYKTKDKKDLPIKFKFIP